MRLLFVTQALDLDDPTLSVYHGWVQALAQRSESVVAICLKEGRHDLPANVRVYSLGKEKGSASAIIYAMRFLSLVWKLRHEYDRVFVHMNQEYILIAGWLWELLNKPVYMWRNHYAGSVLTDLAASTCTKVFCTSKHSYTAKYKKTVLMPVGVDLSRFGAEAVARREPRSILFLARLAPSKRPDMLIEALGMLLSRSISFVASVYGSPLPENEAYYANVKAQAERLGLYDRVKFHPGIPNEQAASVFQAHDIFVNCSKSGMYDKTLFEAAASGCLVLASSDDFQSLAGAQHYFATASELATRLEEVLSRTDDQRYQDCARMQSLAQSQSLAALCDSLARELYS